METERKNFEFLEEKLGDKKQWASNLACRLTQLNSHLLGARLVEVDSGEAKYPKDGDCCWVGRMNGLLNDLHQTLEVLQGEIDYLERNISYESKGEENKHSDESD